jgi:hypothetical protein
MRKNTAHEKDEKYEEKQLQRKDLCVKKVVRFDLQATVAMCRCGGCAFPLV